MNTAAQQSAGGSQSAAVGQGALRSARTRNAGTADAAIAESSRGAGQQLGDEALKTQIDNAELQQKQQQSGLSGLEHLYGEDVSGANSSLGIVPQAINANTGEENASWDWAKDVLAPVLQAAGQAGGAAAKGCWIAEAIYGIDDPRTHLARWWLNGPFRETAYGRIVMRIYLAVGRQVAEVVKRSVLLRRILKPLFDRAVKSAMAC